MFVSQEEKGKSDRKYLDFLDILLTAKDENGQGLTQIEIRNEVDTFLFEGTYTGQNKLGIKLLMMHFWANR